MNNKIVEVIRNMSPEKLNSLMTTALLNARLKEKYATDVEVKWMCESDFDDVFGIVYTRRLLPSEDVLTPRDLMQVPVHVIIHDNDIAFEVDRQQLKDEISFQLEYSKDDLSDAESLRLDREHRQKNEKYFKNVIWDEQSYKKAHQKKFAWMSLNSFKLDNDVKQYFSYGKTQQRLLADLVNALRKLESDEDTWEKPILHGFTFDQLQIPDYYKADSKNGDDLGEEWPTIVNVLTKHYGQIPKFPLYRGVSLAELNSIKKQLQSGKTTFKRSRCTSFTSRLDHAKNFATYGGGSIVDFDNHRDAGDVLTIHCKVPQFYLDEYLFYWFVAGAIAGTDDSNMSQKQIFEDVTLRELEWIVSKDASWKIVDADKLIFEVS